MKRYINWRLAILSLALAVALTTTVHALQPQHGPTTPANGGDPLQAGSIGLGVSAPGNPPGLSILYSTAGDNGPTVTNSSADAAAVSSWNAAGDGTGYIEMGALSDAGGGTGVIYSAKSLDITTDNGGYLHFNDGALLGGFETTNHKFFLHADDGVLTLPRMNYFFDQGKEAALTANESMGTYKTTRAITIESITLDIKISPTCSVSEQITCYDCGAAAGACTAAQTSTIMNAVTIASGATRTSIAESINQASVAAGEFISCLVTAGTCTVADNAISITARPQ